MKVRQVVSAVYQCVCNGVIDFLQLITDVRGKVEKQISTAGFSLFYGSII